MKVKITAESYNLLRAMGYNHEEKLPDGDFLIKADEGWLRWMYSLAPSLEEAIARRYSEMPRTPKQGDMNWLRMESRLQNTFTELKLACHRNFERLTRSDLEKALMEISSIIGEETGRGYPLDWACSDGRELPARKSE